MQEAKFADRFRFIFLIICIFLIGYIGRYSQIDIVSIQSSLSKIPFIYSGLLFILFYVVVTFFIWLSKDVFRLASAIAFGPYLSTLLVFIAEAINAFILFHLARYLGRSYVENKLAKISKDLDQRLSRLSFFWLLMLRAVPLVPFRFLDLAMGLTDISFKKYFLAVVLVSPIRIFWLQLVLSGVGKSVLDNPEAVQKFLLAHKSLLLFSILYLFLVLTVFIKLKRKE